VARAKTFGNTTVGRGIVRTTVESDVRVVTLARPARRNAPEAYDDAVVAGTDGAQGRRRTGAGP